MGENNPSRRSILRSASVVGATGVAALAQGSFAIQAAAKEASKIEVRKPTDRERQRAIKVARSRSEFDSLQEEYDEHAVQIGKSRVRHVTEKNGDTRYVVLFPLKRTGKPEKSPSGTRTESYLVYNGVDTVSDRLTSDVSSEDLPSVSLYKVEVREDKEDLITKHTVKNGDVVKKTAETQLYGQTPENQSDGDVEANGCDTCYKTDISCSYINYECALLVAGSYVTAFTACAVCVASAGWIIPACGYCLGGVLLAGSATIGCDVGDCSTTSSCVPESKCYRYCNYIGCTL